MEDYTMEMTVSNICCMFVSPYDPPAVFEVRKWSDKGEILFRGTRTETMNYFENTNWLVGLLELKKEGYILMTAFQPGDDI